MKLISRACFEQSETLKMQSFFFRTLFVGPAFLAKTVETGDKNCDDFHCMEMSLVMSMWFILGDDWNNTQCLSRLRAFLPCKKSEFIFFVKTGYVSCLYDIVSR